MQVASLVGFATAFVLVAWATSLLGRVGAVAIAPVARRYGPALERRLLEVAAFAPLFIASSVVSILVVASLLGDDHCLEHYHHAHFCLVHGGPWAEEVWAVALVGFAASLVIWRLVRLVASAVRSRRALEKLRAIASYSDGIRWVPTQEPVCFVTRDTEIFVSTGAWDALDPQERRSMIEHERAHIAHRDVLRRFVLDLISLGAGPWMALRARWDAVTERLCDARAAAETGDQESVASALVKLARLQRSTTTGMLGFTPNRDSLSPRIQSLLDELPIGDRTGRRAAVIACGMSLVLVMLLARHASVVHDILESVCS